MFVFYAEGFGRAFADLVDNFHRRSVLYFDPGFFFWVINLGQSYAADACVFANLRFPNDRYLAFAVFFVIYR